MLPDQSLHPLIISRRSPYAFAPDQNVSEQDVRALFEAARWTMSSYNAQPWRYIVANKQRQPEVWQQIHDILLEGNKPWAANAPVLALGVITHYFDYNHKPNKAALHDLGAATASLTFEATHRGLVVHQMIGIDPEKANETFDLEYPMEAYTGIAIGYKGSPDVIPEEFANRDSKVRERKPMEQLILAGGF